MLLILSVCLVQRSKLTFSKGCLLATFNCKMVAIKKYSVAKKKENVKGRTLHDILHIDKKGKTLHVFNTLLLLQ